MLRRRYVSSLFLALALLYPAMSMASTPVMAVPIMEAPPPEASPPTIDTPTSPLPPVITPQPTPTPTPVVGSKLRFGGFYPGITDPAADMSVVSTSESRWGHPVDIINYYQAWGDHDPGWRVPRVDVIRKLSPRQALITWEPWDPAAGPWNRDYSLQAIANGRFDSYIDSWAKALAAYDGVVYLRPMHEMNGNWYPWGGGLWGNPARDYIAAWRHMHDLFVRDGAMNVRWVWAVNAQDVPDSNHFEQYYPGTSYVDVLGMDGYNWGDTQWWSHWQSFDDVFGGSYLRLSRLGDQPIWIAETASASRPGSRSEWIADMWQRVVFYPRLEAIVWFNSTKETDWSGY
jgi:beta-mannanase